MADFIYHNFYRAIMSGEMDLHGAGSNVCNVALYTVAGAADDTTYSTTNEHAASGNYTQGGVALTAANSAVADDDANNWATWDNTDDPTWSTATISAAYAKVYNATVSSLYICEFDFGGTKASTAGTYKITFNASGILKIA
jgi:hypothetical protein